MPVRMVRSLSDGSRRGRGSRLGRCSTRPMKGGGWRSWRLCGLRRARRCRRGVLGGRMYPAVRRGKDTLGSSLYLLDAERRLDLGIVPLWELH